MVECSLRRRRKLGLSYDYASAYGTFLFSAFFASLHFQFFSAWGHHLFLSYFHLTDPMRKYSEEQSCMSLTFSIAILYGFFLRGKMVLALLKTKR